ncbi:MAG: Bug family tripartite tricarboxylate transporter substrate binding protein [Betaproteobacteria bacterium]|jgi:tripartite-type tricarboxylate transporter receptor subunit TctC|nr:tripartite tricarboxylate transporter substrate binding protein [Betaproteobacteria bacterium]
MRALWMLSLFCVAGTAAAQGAYPVKPVRFISPFAPGGGTDTVARALAQRMGDALGKTFIVDNRPGAEGIIGTELGAKSPPDGYTLLVANLGTLAINPNLRKVPYDPLRDFAPVIQTTSSSTVLVVHPSLPAKSVRDLVALARAKPLNYGASSSATFLPMEMLKQMAKFEMTHVPYKGTGPALTGILSGEVQAMFGGAINTVPQVRSGKLRALAVAGDRRARALPDVPTVAESGFPGYEANSWNGIVAPAGTPRAIVARLNGEMLKILALKEVVDYMTADGAEPAGNTPEHFGSYIRSEHAKWQRVIRDAMIASQ